MHPLCEKVANFDTYLQNSRLKSLLLGDFKPGVKTNANTNAGTELVMKRDKCLGVKLADEYDRLVNIACNLGLKLKNKLISSCFQITPLTQA